MPGFELFGEEERKEVQDVLNTGVLSRYGFDQLRNDHWKAKRFEAELAERLKTKYCHLCSNGSAALAIALVSCGVGAGDEVIVPPFTFIATIEAVINIGAVPVFAEVDETLCLDPEALNEVIAPRTKAVVPVHMCGSMARIAEIKTLCERQGLILVEDACQAIGATYQQKALGTFGQMGCFSFDPVKTITCGEGGAVITDNQSLYLRATAYADHGHDHIGSDRGLEGHSILGTNLRISELNAAVGLAQLRKIDLMLEKQRQNKQIIKAALEQVPEITFQKIPDEQGDSATFLSFFLPNESAARRFSKELSQVGVDGCFYWYDNNWHYFRQWQHLKTLSASAKLPLQLLPNYPNYQKVELPRSDEIVGKVISMQIRISWTETEIEQRIEKILQVAKILSA